MRVSWKRAATVLAAVAVVSAGVVGSASAASSSPGSEPGAATASRPLLELRAPNDTGWLYTVAPQEVASAASQGYRPEHVDLGSLSPTQDPDTTPFYRLRYRAQRSYLTTASSQERDRAVATGGFEYEGVIGFIAKGPRPGYSELFRYFKNGHWRLGFIERQPEMVADGYRLEGPVGWTARR